MVGEGVLIQTSRSIPVLFIRVDHPTRFILILVWGDHCGLSLWIVLEWIPFEIVVKIAQRLHHLWLPFPFLEKLHWHFVYQFPHLLCAMIRHATHIFMQHIFSVHDFSEMPISNYNLNEFFPLFSKCQRVFDKNKERHILSNDKIESGRGKTRISE